MSAAIAQWYTLAATVTGLGGREFESRPSPIKYNSKFLSVAVAVNAYHWAGVDTFFPKIQHIFFLKFAPKSGLQF